MTDYLEPYRRAVRNFGPKFEATLWLSREKQQLRFEVIASMVDFRDAVVVDAGCGLGDLAEFLVTTGVRYRAYVGLEGVEELVTEANARGLPHARFHCVDFVADPDAFTRLLPAGRSADIVVFSGSLNTLEESHAREVLAGAWNSCSRALVFNFLSQRGGEAASPDTGPARRFDPLTMLEWALNQTPRVRFRQDYMAGHDATIALFRKLPTDPDDSAA